MKRTLIITFTCLSLSVVAQTVTNFSAMNIQDGTTTSLADFNSSPGVVIIFTGNACAFDGYYNSRIARLIADYNPRIPVLLVNPHLGASEDAPAMKARMEQTGIKTPYLADKDQVIMQQLKATRSPEAFVLQRSGDKFVVVYRGAIDDNPQVESDVRERYLTNAIDAILEGKKPVVADVRPLGCIIRKK